MPVSRLLQDKTAAFETHGKDCHHDDTPVGVRAKRRQRAAARAHVGLKPMQFVSLHHHTTFSYLDGFQLPEAHVRRATEINMGAIAFTEHGNISSHVKAEEASSETGVKPIFGCELYTGGVGKKATQRKYHLTVLAQDAAGYRNLLSLVSRSFSEGFYHEPTVSGRMLREEKDGLIVLSGCQGSMLFCSAVGGKLVEERDASYARAKKVAQRFRQALGDQYYIEVQAFPELEKTRQFNPMAARLSHELDIPLVATKDCHYTVPEEAEIQKVLHNIRPGNKQTLEDQEREWGYDVPLCPPPTDKAIYRQLRATGLSHDDSVRAILNTAEVSARCNVTLPKLPMLRYPLPSGYTDSVKLWRDWLREGWYYRGFDKLTKAEQRKEKQALKYEMDIIEDKGFVDYFLVVSDSVKFAKDQGIPVGPARGSAAASRCAYLLRITEVNPRLFDNLVFERFIDVSRSDLPDIDLDFDSDRRHEVRDYLVSKYGGECVNNIGTFSYYKSKMSLDDVGKVHHVPKFEVEKVKELLIERSSGDLRASATIEDTVDQFDDARDVVERYPELRKAMELEGNVKQFGVHSAGLVVSNGDIREVAAVYQREIKGHPVQVVSMDKYDAERQGLLKLDYLGLSTMAMISEALRQLDMKLEDLYDLPLDDPKVIRGFQENDVVGVFQFDGRAMRSVCGALKPDSFDEICDVNALARPGPLHNGAANEYIDIKRGAKQPEKIHPALDDITSDTHFQIVYQEQILKVVTIIGNFDWTHAAEIRRIISRKKGEQEFQRQYARFEEGALTLHERADYPEMTPTIVKQIFGLCITSGSYAFNAAHCRSYGMLGYWTMWLKRYHPAVFYASSLAKMPKAAGSGSAAERGGSLSGVKTDRHAQLMRDAVRGSASGERASIEILPPHPRRSGKSWKPTHRRRKLLAGFEQAEGIGPAVADKLVAYREANEVRRWDDYLEVKGVGAKTIARFRALQGLDDPFNVRAIDRMLDKCREGLTELGLPMPTHTAEQVPYERGSDQLITWIGIGIHRNLRDIFESNRARTGVELKPEDVKEPDKNEWLMILGTDGDEQVTLRIDRFKYPRFRAAAWGLKLGQDVLLVQGIKPGWRTAREIYVKKLWVLDPEG